MDTVTTIDEVRERVRGWRRAGQRIVLVPTMGNLHAGHVSLIEAASAHGERRVASIFVNPTQFGPHEDFNRYPRTPQEDQRALEEAGCDLVFTPEVGQMYPGGTGEGTVVHVPGLTDILEGAIRPGHFDGVTTVVAKLFNIVQPDTAVFGQKDFQQFAVIRRMVRDLCLPIILVGAPTVRAPDGLALSSRNQYLSAAERETAPQLSVSLRQAGARLSRGDSDLGDIEQEGLAHLASRGFKPDYFTIRDASTLQPPAPDTRALVILTAARLGTTRLIDNLTFTR